MQALLGIPSPRDQLAAQIRSNKIKMSIKGSLDTMSLSDLLQFLGSGRKSGTLRFDRGKISKQVYFQNGLIVGSRSNDPREYLGQVLLHYAKVDEPQLQLAREAQRRSGVRLGEALIQLGMLTEKDVLEVLRIRTLDAILICSYGTTDSLNSTTKNRCRPI